MADISSECVFARGQRMIERAEDCAALRKWKHGFALCEDVRLVAVVAVM